MGYVVFVTLSALLVGWWIGKYTGYQKGVIDGLKEGLDVVKEHNKNNSIPIRKHIDELINKTR